MTLPAPSSRTPISYEIVRSAQRGDPAALQTVGERACTLALRTAAALIGDREEARDVAQDVGVDVLRGLGRLRDPIAFDGWVHRIATRHIQRAIRKRTLQRAVNRPLLQDVEWDEALSEQDRSELIATREALSAALSQLPLKQRLAVVLRYVHDLSDAEIAAALDCRIGNVHSLLSRARSSLRHSDHLRSMNPIHQGEAK